MVWFATALAADGTPPEWPDGAALQVSQTQLLLDHPPETVEELRETFGAYTLDLTWPAATDDLAVEGYELACNGERALPLAADATRWTGRVTGERRCLLVALDAAGHRSRPLRATSPAFADWGMDHGVLGTISGVLGGAYDGLGSVGIGDGVVDLVGSRLGAVPAGPVEVAWIDASGALTEGTVSDAMSERLVELERCASRHPVAEKLSVMILVERTAARATVAVTSDPEGPLGTCLATVVATVSDPPNPFRAAIGLDVRPP